MEIPDLKIAEMQGFDYTDYCERMTEFRRRRIASCWARANDLAAYDKDNVRKDIHVDQCRNIGSYEIHIEDTKILDNSSSGFEDSVFAKNLKTIAVELMEYALSDRFLGYDIGIFGIEFLGSEDELGEMRSHLSNFTMVVPDFVVQHPDSKEDIMYCGASIFDLDVSTAGIHAGVEKCHVSLRDSVFDLTEAFALKLEDDFSFGDFAVEKLLYSATKENFDPLFMYAQFRFGFYFAAEIPRGNSVVVEQLLAHYGKSANFHPFAMFGVLKRFEKACYMPVLGVNNRNFVVLKIVYSSDRETYWEKQLLSDFMSRQRIVELSLGSDAVYCGWRPLGHNFLYGFRFLENDLYFKDEVYRQYLNNARVMDGPSLVVLPTTVALYIPYSLAEREVFIGDLGIISGVNITRGCTRAWLLGKIFGGCNVTLCFRDDGGSEIKRQRRIIKSFETSYGRMPAIWRSSLFKTKGFYVLAQSAGDFIDNLKVDVKDAFSYDFSCYSGVGRYERYPLGDLMKDAYAWSADNFPDCTVYAIGERQESLCYDFIVTHASITRERIAARFFELGNDVKTSRDLVVTQVVNRWGPAVVCDRDSDDDNVDIPPLIEDLDMTLD